MEDVEIAVATISSRIMAKSETQLIETNETSEQEQANTAKLRADRYVILIRIENFEKRIEAKPKTIFQLANDGNLRDRECEHAEELEKELSKLHDKYYAIAGDLDEVVGKIINIEEQQVHGICMMEEQAKTKL